MGLRLGLRVRLPYKSPVGNLYDLQVVVRVRIGIALGLAFEIRISIRPLLVHALSYLFISLVPFSPTFSNPNPNPYPYFNSFYTILACY
jgi:hypothetical protein